MATHATHAAHAAASAAETPNADEPAYKLDFARHTKYQLRCVKTLLPNAYTGNDANRMMLAYFALASLDLLDKLDTGLKEEERSSFIEWIYNCQLPDGGFRAFPGTDFGAERKDSDNATWDPANSAGTLFALVNLLLLGDDLSRVRMKETLAWVHKLQHEDGSFAEIIGPDGEPYVGQDMRYAYMAVAIRHILRGEEDEGAPDIDTEKLVQFVVDSQQYDGGIGKSPGHESHAGYTFCGLSILPLIGKLPTTALGKEQYPVATNGAVGRDFLDAAIRWLVHRQTPEPVSKSDDEESDVGDDEDGIEGEHGDSNQQHSFQKLGAFLPGSDPSIHEPLNVTAEDVAVAGFNGRSNKPGDTCYSFWVVGSLRVLEASHMIDPEANRAFLLSRTQNDFGGFGKLTGLPPDILHSFFGLSALSLTNEPGLKPVAAALAVSTDIRDRVDRLPWKRSV